MTSYKIIITAGEYVLTLKGFRHKNDLRASTIKLFNDTYKAKKFFDTCGLNHVKPEFKRVKITYEELESLCV